jgi:DNA-binding transcriptional LysR family regulator
MIGSFKAMHPKVGVSLDIGGSARIFTGVIQGEFEMGVIGWVKDDPRVQTEEIFSDQLALAVRPDHRWADRGVIDLDELDGEPFVIREKGSGTRAVMFQILESMGFDSSGLNIVARLGGTEAIKQAIKAGVGVSVLSRLAIEEDLDSGRLRAIDIRNLSWKRTFHMVFRRHRALSPVCEAFADHLRPTERGL